MQKKKNKKKKNGFKHYVGKVLIAHETLAAQSVETILLEH